MMTLPTFTKKDPSVAWLRQNQRRLQAQADEMLTATGLVAVFRRYGEVTFGGSYAYDLMVYPDLDFGIVADSVPKSLAGELVGAICALDGVHRVAFADLIHFEPRRRVKGYWLGIEVPFEGDLWGVDVVLQQRDWSRPDKLGSSMKGLSQATRDAILAIKYELIRRGEYGSKHTAGELYEAVLKHGLTDVGALDRWAAQHAEPRA